MIVSICTGRLYSGTQAVAHALSIHGPIACVDGGQIVDAESDRPVQCSALDPDELQRLALALQGLPLALFAFSADRIVHDVHGLRYRDAIRTWSEQLTLLDDEFKNGSWLGLPELAAIVAVGSRQAVNGIQEMLKKEKLESVQVFGFPLPESGSESAWAALLRRSDVNKGTATQWLAHHHGVALSDVVAVGDWINDLPMFETAGLSFAMGHAPPEVQAAASCRLEATIRTGGGIEEAAMRSGLL